jgi:hypothetical protein
MRFLLGLLGGAISSVVLALIMAIVSVSTGRGAMHPFGFIGSAIVNVASGGSSDIAAPVGALLVIAVGTLLGGVFTSVMCGMVATGPGIGIGLVYGFGIWVLLQYFLLPVLDPALVTQINRTAFASASLFFGALLGVWVIVASHIWKELSMKCQV